MPLELIGSVLGYHKTKVRSHFRVEPIASSLTVIASNLNMFLNKKYIPYH